MICATAFIHLPGVVLPGEQCALGPGRIARLPFETWQTLDPAFRDTDRKYERSHPVFWIGDIPGETDDEATPSVFEISFKLHLAFLLEETAPRLPTPSLSTRYLRVRASSEASEAPVTATKRLFGPMEREWLVFGSPLTCTYDAAALSRVATMYGLVERTDPACSVRGIGAGLRTLEWTARPDSWHGGDSLRHDINEFIHCVAASEHILLPSAEERLEGGITEMFGRHAAALLCHEPAALEANAKGLSDVYRLRSRLIHGRIGARDLTERQRAQLPLGRRLLREILVSALRLGTGNEGLDFPALLSDAFANPIARDELRRRVASERIP
jgi:hypothetical protein